MPNKHCQTIERTYDIRTMPDALLSLLNQLDENKIDTATFISGVRAFHQDLHLYFLMADSVDFPIFKTVAMPSCHSGQK